jgi:hypothetical protein
MSVLSYAQVSMDMGARKQFAKFWSIDFYEALIPRYSNRYFNDSYFVKLNKEKNKWILSTELSYTPKAL